MSYRHPPRNSKINHMYDAVQIAMLAKEPKLLGILPSVAEATELGRFDLAKDRRALSVQFLAVTMQASLVLLQVGREETRVVWNFGQIILDNTPPPEVAAIKGFDDPNQG